ncbi:hypothetical protein EI555_003272 [Monodon monoceros]|uniref:Uncharacterized protein n=1 Tax=Monodon monoceros TaxID=40151 RepID=A0A4U1EHD9_MONMO|nr:hypothetical protein EI555_003272 [Monodon monoceros]
MWPLRAAPKGVPQQNPETDRFVSANLRSLWADAAPGACPLLGLTHPSSSSTKREWSWRPLRFGGGETGEKVRTSVLGAFSPGDPVPVRDWHLGGTWSLETFLRLASQRSGRSSQVAARRVASEARIRRRCTGAQPGCPAPAREEVPLTEPRARGTRPGRTPRRPPPQPSGPSLGREEELAGDFEAVQSLGAGARHLLPQLGRGSGAGRRSWAPSERLTFLLLFLTLFKAGDGSPASAPTGALGARWWRVSRELPSTGLGEPWPDPVWQPRLSPLRVALRHSHAEMSAQSLLHSVFSCSSPASGSATSAKGFSKRKLRQTRSLDPALIGGCGGEAGSEGGSRGATGGRVCSPLSLAEGLGSRLASSPRGPPPRVNRLPSPRPLCSSFSTPSTPLEKSPSGSFHFDYEVPLGRSGLKKSMVWDLPTVLAGPGSGRSTILCSSAGGPNGIFASPRRWLQQRKFQSPPDSHGQPYVVWKSEVYVNQDFELEKIPF